MCRGPKGNDEFFHPEVVAVNKFRKEMDGEKEYIGTAADGSVVELFLSFPLLLIVFSRKITYNFPVRQKYVWWRDVVFEKSETLS